MFLFLEGLQPENVLILLFSMKPFSRLMAKISSEANNSF